MPLLSDLAEVLRTSCLGRLAADVELPALSIGQEEDESEEESERKTLLPTCKGWDGMG